MLIPVSIQHLFGGSQFGQVDVFNPADLAQKVLEVVSLGEARQLRDVVQSDVHKTLHARLS